MLYAINEYGNRIEPFEKGKAKCSFCKSKMIAVCGDINIHHWRHEVSPKCDPWKGHETEWHRKWKTFFPESWREIIIAENNETHIADIKTENGLIVEFQNSSISNRTIQEREDFYKNMIWVVNAVKFKDNFTLWSKVKSKLRELDERDYGFYEDHEKEPKPFEEELLHINGKIDKKNQELNELSVKIVISKDYLKDVENVTNKKISNDYFHFSDPLYDFTSNIFECFTKNNSECKIIKEQLEKSTKNLDYIQSFKNSSLSEYELFREVEFKNVKKSNFNKCVVVLKEEEKSFFPIIIKLKDVLDFNWYSKKKNEYKILINLSETEKKLEKTIKSSNDKISTQQKERINLTIRLKKEITVFLKSNIQEWESKYDETVSNSIKLSEKYDLIEKKQFELFKKKNEEAIANHKKWKEKEKTIRYNIMKSNKGIYYYNWKYRRPSWDYAKKKIYLDFGQEIFEVKSDNEFIKMSIDDLIKKIKN